MPDGRSVFTDRACTDIGAVERLPRAEASGGAARAYRGGCARNLQDLVFEVTTAIDARDANRLANVYHWPGMSGSTAYAIWNRLDMVVNRPLVDIAPVMPRSPEPEPIIVDGNDMDVATEAPAERAKRADPLDGDLYPQTTVRRTPIGLRVEQTLGKSSTPSRTVFGLTRHFGCWWIRF
ncbi:MAG TPA: hypothetical protein VGD21_12515 [Lysobacter sp.]